MSRNEEALIEAEGRADQQVITFYLLVTAALATLALLALDLTAWHDLLAGLVLGGALVYLAFTIHLVLVKLDRSLSLMDTLERYGLEEEDFPD